MNKNKKITRFLAVAFLSVMLLYAASIIGTLVHELTHARYAEKLSYIKINYDTTGSAKGQFFKHSHKWVYLNQYIVEAAVLLLSAVSIIIIVEHQ